MICLIVVINLRDLREWKRYVGEREENIAALGDFENPLYQSNTTTTRNPNRKSFFGKWFFEKEKEIIIKENENKWKEIKKPKNQNIIPDAVN